MDRPCDTKRKGADRHYPFDTPGVQYSFMPLVHGTVSTYLHPVLHLGQAGSSRQDLIPRCAGLRLQRLPRCSPADHLITREPFHVLRCCPVLSCHATPVPGAATCPCSALQPARPPRTRPATPSSLYGPRNHLRALNGCTKYHQAQEKARRQTEQEHVLLTPLCRIQGDLRLLCQAPIPTVSHHTQPHKGIGTSSGVGL